MRDWLEANGWPDVFLDLDPERGVRAGEAWQQALIGAADRCEAIICLLTPQWVGSKWCWAEYVLAKKLGKKCFPVIAAPINWEALPLELRAEHQIIDLEKDPQAWTRLRFGLEAAGVGAARFGLPEGRRPYPGLQALTEEDAALFFGRDAEILAALDELRRMAQTPARRLLVLLGPSGAGKSSLLRAGLWPRLARDDRNYFPLPTIRPGNAVLTDQHGFWAAIEGAFATERIASQLPEAVPRTRGAIRAAADQDDSLYQSLFDSLGRAAAGAALLEEGASPTLILPIDQGEELFLIDGRTQARRFLHMLGQLLATPGGPIAVMAIRTDAYSLLQADRQIAGNLHQPFNLGPMPADRFRAVIQGPAERVGLELEPALIDALVEDARGADALPLLAFTMEHLYRDFGAAGALKLEDYHAFGGVRGAIEASVNTAFAAAPGRGLPQGRESLLRLTRRLFLPHLVRVNEKGEFARRSALLTEIAEDLQVLTQLFVDQRLLVADRDKESGHDTIEIAHEALLRAWPRMAAWLEEEREFLIWREEITHARARWQDGRRDLLSGRELAIALSWRAERPADVAPEELAFIVEGEQKAAAEAAREKRRQAWLTRLAVTAALIFAVFGGLSLWQWFEAINARDGAQRQAKLAKEQAKLAQARELAIQAETLLDQQAGATTLAGLLAVESLRATHTIEGYRAWRRVMELTPTDITEFKTPWPGSPINFSPDQRLVAFSEERGYTGPAAGGMAVLLNPDAPAPRASFRHKGWVIPVFSPDGRWVALAGFGRKLQVIDAASGMVKTETDYDDMIAAAFGPDGRRLFVARTDGIVEIREAPEWAVTRRLSYPATGRRPSMKKISISPDGNRVAVVSRGPKVPVHLIPVDGSAVVSLLGHDRGTRRTRIGTVGKRVIFDATGQRIATSSYDLTVRVWDARSGVQLHSFEHPSEIQAMAIGHKGPVVVTTTRDGEIFVWDLDSGAQGLALRHDAEINAVVISATDQFVATASDDHTAAIWDLETGKQLHRLRHDSGVWSLALSADESILATGGKDGLVRFFDVASGQELRRLALAGPVISLEFDPTSTDIAVGVALSKHEQAWTDVVIADRVTQAPVLSFSHAGGLRNTLFSPDGRTFAATVQRTREIKLWDVANGTLRPISTAKAINLVFSPDGERLITDPGEGQAFILDAQSGEPIANIGEPGGVTVFGLSSDRRILTTFGKDGSFRGWDTRNGKELWRRMATRAGQYPKLCADGSRFATYRDDKRVVEVVNTKGGHLIAAIPSSVRSDIELSTDGRRLLLSRRVSPAPGSSEEPFFEVELWDVDQDQQIWQRKLSLPSRAWLDDTDGRAIIADPITRTAELIDAREGATIWSGDLSGSARIFSPKFAPNRLVAAGRIWDLATGTVIAQGRGDPNDVEATQDGKKLVLASGEKIEIRDATTGELIASFEAGGDVTDMALSEDGRYLFAALGDKLGRITVREVKDGSEVSQIEFEGYARGIFPLADPDRVLIHDSAGVHIHQVSTRLEEHRFAHTAMVRDIVVATAADRAATVHQASIRVWDTSTGTEIAQRVSKGGAGHLAISPDGRRVAYTTDRPLQPEAGETFERLVLWEPDSRHAPRILPARVEGEVVFDPSSERIAVRLRDNTAMVWEVRSLRSVATIRALPGGKLSEIAFSHDGRHLLIRETKRSSGRFINGLRVWDLKENRELARVDSGGGWAQIPGSDRVMVRGGQGDWRTWSPETTGVETTAWETGLAYLKLSSDPETGKLGYVGLHRGMATVLDIDTGEQTQLSKHVEKRLSGYPEISVAQGARYVAVGWPKAAEDEKPIVIVYDVDSRKGVARLKLDTAIDELQFVDGDDVIVVGQVSESFYWHMATRLHLWRWRTGETQTIITDNPINAVATSSDGVVFATGEGTREKEKGDKWVDRGIFQARLWDARTGAERLRLPHKEPVYDVDFSKDGRLLATRSTFEITVFGVRDGEKLASFRMEHGLSGGRGKVQFASDGRYVVANVAKGWFSGEGEDSGGVRVWSVDGKESFLLRHEDDWPVFEVSPDGSFLATKDKGDAIRVWDIASRTERVRAAVPKVSYTLTFAGKRDNLIVEAGGQLVRALWRTDDLIEEACRRLTRDMTEEEWRRYIPNEPYRATCKDGETEIP